MFFVYNIFVKFTHYQQVLVVFFLSDNSNKCLKIENKTSLKTKTKINETLFYC